MRTIHLVSAVEGRGSAATAASSATAAGSVTALAPAFVDAIFEKTEEIKAEAILDEVLAS